MDGDESQKDELHARRRARASLKLPTPDPSRHPSRTNDRRRHLAPVPDQPLSDEPIVVERPTLKLSDVVGLATVKRVLSTIVNSADASNSGDGSWLGGALFYGPPNCGKHFSARVVAGELEAELWNINMSAATSVPAVLRRIRTALEADAERKVFFLEHLDADLGHVDQHAGALLSNLVPLFDSARQHNGSLVLGSAVYPWKVSPLALRTGRLDDVLLVLPPDGPARRKFLCQRLGTEKSPLEESIDWLVDNTDGYSFGDLEHLLYIAREVLPVKKSLDPRELSHEALITAQQVSSPTSADWLEQAAHHANIAKDASMYADLRAYFTQRSK